MMRRMWGLLMWGLLAVFLLAASAPAEEGVSINSGTFPDPQFLNYVETFDGDNNGRLSTEEIARVSSIDVKSKNIQDLKGIKYFTELKNLDCARNQLTALDVSENKKLEHLDCTGNRLTSLDVSENTALMKLYCNHNKLTVLDVSKNKALGELNCAFNQLTALNVRENEKLTALFCNNNKLTVLDVSRNPELMNLFCNNNKLTVLDLGADKKIHRLYCQNNVLTSLDVRENTALTELHCHNNKLTVLDVSKNTDLKTLYCNSNHLTFLDLQGLNDLSDVYVGGQTRDGIVLLQSGGAYVLDLGAFILEEGFDKVSGLAGQAGGTTLPAAYTPTSGKARFTTKPDKVTYEYNTGKTDGGNPVKMDVALTVTGVTVDYTIQVTVSGHGRVTRQGSTDPLSGDVTVSAGSNVTFVASADAGHEIEYLKVDGAPLAVPAGTAHYEHPFPNVAANHRLEARFKAKPVPQFTITVIPSGHGRVTRQGATDPLSGDVTVSAGSSMTFVVSADAGHEIDYLKVDGAPVGVLAGTAHYEHPFPNVAANHRLEARFKPKPVPQFTIQVTVSGNGRVTRQGSTDPLSGDVTVSAGSNVTFVASADAGHEIEYLKVDGAPLAVPAGTAHYEHPFPNVAANHRLEAKFKPKPAPPVNPPIPPVNPPAPPAVQHTITVTASGHGRVMREGSTEALSGNVAVFPGSSVTFVISADAGYEIDYLEVNNTPVSIPAGTTRYEHTIPNVAANHRLEARFKPRPVPPVNPPTPPANPPAPPADIPVAIAADQWTVFWGTRDAQGSVGVTVQVPINSETPLIASSIRVEASEIWNVRIKLLFDIRADSSSVSAHTTAQNRSYVLQITGTVAESARDTARIDAVHYRLEGSDEEWTVRFGTDGGGILLKDMRKGAEMDSSSGEGGCAAGLGLEMLLVLVPFCIWRRH